MNIKKLFKEPKTKPLPAYPPILLENIRPASTLLFYGGNKLTGLVGNRLYRHPYRPPAFHAALYINDGIFLNVGKFKTLERVESHFRSTYRIDVITYKLLPTTIRNAICKEALLDTSRPRAGVSLPDYSWTDYLRFGLRFLKPSKNDFCSENVVELFSDQSITVSGHKAVDTAPWDLQEYAEKHPLFTTIETLYLGNGFKGD